MSSEINFQGLLQSASHLQELVPGAVLVGGTAVALYAQHRMSEDHGHVLVDLTDHYRVIFDALSSNPDFVVSRRHSKSPVTILGTLDGYRAGVRQLRRLAPLETCIYTLSNGKALTVPTLEEVLRVKAYLAVTRTTLRDYIDVAALAYTIGVQQSVRVLKTLPRYYEDSKNTLLRDLRELMLEPNPKDGFSDYRKFTGLAPILQDWGNVYKICVSIGRELK